MDISEDLRQVLKWQHDKIEEIHKFTFGIDKNMGNMSTQLELMKDDVYTRLIKVEARLEMVEKTQSEAKTIRDFFKSHWKFVLALGSCTAALLSYETSQHLPLLLKLIANFKS